MRPKIVVPEAANDANYKLNPFVGLVVFAICFAVAFFTVPALLY